MEKEGKRFENINYVLTDNDLKVIDSYKVSKKEFKPFINYVKEENPDVSLFKHRKVWHMCLEWATHNFLYKLGIKPESTKDVDLNYPLPWYEKIGYFVIGCISWLFIK